MDEPKRNFYSVAKGIAETGQKPTTNRYSTAKAVASSVQPSPEHQQRRTTEAVTSAVKPAPEYQQRTAAHVAAVSTNEVTQGTLEGKRQSTHAFRSTESKRKSQAAVEAAKHSNEYVYTGKNPKTPHTQKEYDNMYKAYQGDNAKNAQYRGKGGELDEAIAYQMIDQHQAKDIRKLSNAIKNHSPESSNRYVQTAEKRRYANATVTNAVNKYKGNIPREENTRKPTHHPIATPSIQKTASAVSSSGYKPGGNDGGHTPSPSPNNPSPSQVAAIYHAHGRSR